MSRHLASANGQRGAKAQPAGRFAGSAGRPGITASGSSRDVSMDGTAASSARVYGCRACAARSAAGRSSTIRPAYMTSTRSQTCPTTVMSWLMNSSAAVAGSPGST